MSRPLSHDHVARTRIIIARLRDAEKQLAATRDNKSMPQSLRDKCAWHHSKVASIILDLELTDPEKQQTVIIPGNQEGSTL